MNTQLNSLDFKILKYISKHEHASITQICEALQYIVDVENRIRDMAYPQDISITTINNKEKRNYYIAWEYNKFCQNSTDSKMYLDLVYLTDYGKRALQDYKQNKKESRNEFVKRSIIVPIIVSIVANQLVNAIILMLSS